MHVSKKCTRWLAAYYPRYLYFVYEDSPSKIGYINLALAKPNVNEVLSLEQAPGAIAFDQINNDLYYTDKQSTVIKKTNMGKLQHYGLSMV